jgi:hypothetical protein
MLESSAVVRRRRDCALEERHGIHCTVEHEQRSSQEPKGIGVARRAPYNVLAQDHRRADFPALQLLTRLLQLAKY